MSPRLEHPTSTVQASAGTSRVALLCVGNELAHDDGVGVRVGRVLLKLALPEGVSVHFFQDLGLGALELFAESERVILVDALSMGGKPGSCRELTLAQLTAHVGHPCACHSIGLAELVFLATQMSPRAQAAQVTLVGIEAQELSGFGFELSPCVQRALPEAVLRILALLEADATLLSEGRRLAELEATHPPALGSANVW